MAGMKEGPGSDPFADEDDSEDDDAEPDTQAEALNESTDNNEANQQSQTMSTSEIPYVVRRQTVKEERNNEHVAFLRDEYADMEADILDDVADELGMRSNDVSVTDLREAFVALADRHPEEVAAILEDWGYEHLK